MACPHISNRHAVSRSTPPLFCISPAQEIPVDPKEQQANYIGDLGDERLDHNAFEGYREQIGRTAFADRNSPGNIRAHLPLNPQDAGASKTRILESFPLDFPDPEVGSSRQHQYHGHVAQFTDTPSKHIPLFFHPDNPKLSPASKRSHLSSGNMGKDHPAASLSPPTGRRRRATPANSFGRSEHPVPQNQHSRQTPKNLSEMGPGQAHYDTAEDNGKLAKKRAASPPVASRTAKRANLRAGFVMSDDDSENEEQVKPDGQGRNNNYSPVTHQPFFSPPPPVSLQNDPRRIPESTPLPAKQLNRARLNALLRRNKPKPTVPSSSAQQSSIKPLSTVAQRSAPSPEYQHQVSVQANNKKDANPFQGSITVSQKMAGGSSREGSTRMIGGLPTPKTADSASTATQKAPRRTTEVPQSKAQPKSFLQSVLDDAKHKPACVSREREVNEGKGTPTVLSTTAQRPAITAQPRARDQNVPTASTKSATQTASNVRAPGPAGLKGAQAKKPIQIPAKSTAASTPTSIDESSQRGKYVSVSQPSTESLRKKPGSGSHAQKGNQAPVAVAENLREQSMPLKQATTNGHVVSGQQIVTKDEGKGVESRLEDIITEVAVDTAILQAPKNISTSKDVENYTPMDMAQQENVNAKTPGAVTTGDALAPPAQHFKVPQRKDSAIIPAEMSLPSKQLPPKPNAIPTPLVSIPPPVPLPTASDPVLRSSHLPLSAEPYFEYSIFHKSWSTPHDESTATSTELSVHTFTDIYAANAQAEKFHIATHTSLGSLVEEQTCKRDENGCKIHTLTHAHPFFPWQKTHVQFFVKRDEVSKYAGRTTHDLGTYIEGAKLVSSTAYAVRLYKLIPDPDTAASDNDSDSEATKPSDTDESLIRTTSHPHTGCPNVYTTLFSANRAALALQISLSHEAKPTNPLTRDFQTRGLRALQQKLEALGGKQRGDGEMRCWESRFNALGRGGDRLEILVEKVGVVGPRNL